MDNKTLITNFEREVLFQIIFKMKQNKMSSKRAQEIAKIILPEVKKELSNEEFMNNLAKLCGMYPEILDAYIATFKDYEKEFKNERLLNVLNSLEKEIVKGGEN